MDLTPIQLVASIVMVSVSAILIVAYRHYLATNSERRMLAMLAAVGIDAARAARSDSGLTISEARKRCRRCPSEDVCERWLRGDEKGDNRFCPNAKVFAALAGGRRLRH